MVTAVTAIGGLVGLIISLCLLAWQTRAVAQQAKITNAIAGTGVLNDTNNNLREVLLLLVERPELRPYVYEGKPLPHSISRRRRILTVVEMLADALEAGLIIYRLVPSSEQLDYWTEYCCHLLIVCPALNQTVADHPVWWRELNRLRQKAVLLCGRT